MRIITWPNNERVLQHCMICEDANVPANRAKIEKVKQAFEIEKVTTGICADCAAVLESELDDMEQYKKNHSK
jgi:hypothetical protein